MHRTSKRCLYSSILLAAILLAAPRALAEPVPVAKWTFDEAELVATGGVPGDGPGVNGVVADPQPGQTYRPAVVDAPGVHGRCYVFDGRRSVVGTTLRAIIPSAGDFSVTAWIRWDPLASSRGGHYILSNYVSGEPGRTGLEVRDGRLSFFADGTEINARADRVDDGAWHHVAVTRAGSDFSLWVDGAETPIGKSDLAIGTEREWLIGRRLEDEARSFAGHIDDLRVYHAALSGEAIANLVTTGAAVQQASAADRPRVAWAEPLAQSYRIIYKKPDVAGTMVDTPCVVRLASGRLLASNNIDGTWGGNVGQGGLDKVFPGGRNYFVHASDDDGETWWTLARLPLADGMLLPLPDAVYVLGTGRKGNVRRDVFIARSSDGGQTWTPPVMIHEGPAWNSATGVVIRGGTLYRAYDTASHQVDRKLFVLAGDLSKDLLDPRSWRRSNMLGFPGMPVEMKRPLYPQYRDHWLEANVVDLRGRLALIARCRVDEYGTCHIAGVSDLDDRDGKLTLKFSQFYPFPGGQQKFHVVYDTKSDLYWMVGNLVTDPQNHTDWFRHLKRRGYKGGAGNERRILTLFYGLDGLNWLQAGVVALAKDPLQSFMYSHMFIDGDDLLFAVRTSKQGGNNHDAELITFHRVRDFRSLALDIHPRMQPERSE